MKTLEIAKSMQKIPETQIQEKLAMSKPGILGQIPVNYPRTCGQVIELEKDAPRVPSTLNRPSLNRSVSSPAATHSDRRTNPASRTSRPDFRNVLEC